MRTENPAWFRQAKLGLFVHWGLYSLLGGVYRGQEARGVAEWIMNTLQIPAADYEKLAGQFTAEAFDADALVKNARDWGMQYLVFTAKHHEGFAMYDSAASAYSVARATPCHRDILKEVQLACEKYGLRLGLYYSQAQDWHDPNGLAAGQDNSGKDFSFYLEHKAKPQLRELLTNYGEISLVWFDTPLETTAAQSRELCALVRELQPNCLISGRIGNGLGDYLTTSDNFLPRQAIGRDWELPATLNDTWGYKAADHNWKSAGEVIRLLLKVVNRGGNYLLNVGPDGAGRLPPECLPILDEVGRYVRENAEGIFGTQPVPPYPYELAWAEMACKPHKLYIHMLACRDRIELPNVATRALSARLLRDGRALPLQCRPNCENVPTITVFLPRELWQEKGYCVELTLAEQAPRFLPITG